MKNVSRIISCYAADTAGVCSALYELGGMTVVHDASGCNSTYSTHDEPRWYDKDSMIYISALTETDAVMGNDEKLICDVTEAARELEPKFIALCGSPMPMMTGVDFDAAAQEIQRRTGIKTFGFHTNGMNSYLYGASQAFRAAAENFCGEVPKSTALSVNILGATPLDFSLNGSVEAIKDWLTDCGFQVISCFGMGSSLEDISKAAGARVNLVISYSGLAAAEYMLSKFGIPYVAGVPVGEKFSKTLAEALWTAATMELSLFTCGERPAAEDGFAVVGESIFAGSLAAAIRLEEGVNPKVICPLDSDERLLAAHDLKISSEEELEAEFSRLEVICADPMYKPLCHGGAVFYPLPHEAFSGRCYSKDIPNLINRKIGDIK